MDDSEEYREVSVDPLYMRIYQFYNAELIYLQGILAFVQFLHTS